MNMFNRSVAEAAARGAAAEDVAVLTLTAIANGHPTLAYLAPESGHHGHVLTWEDNDGAQWVERESAVPLAAYARARFARPEDEHKPEPLPGTAYSVGPRNAGLPADFQNRDHYPVEAVCRGCKRRIVVNEWLGSAEWEHQERQDG